jgi:hypothetical protein
MFVPTDDGYLLNIQQITQIYFELGEAIEPEGPGFLPGIDDPDAFEKRKDDYQASVGNDKQYATVYALGGGARHILWNGYESKATAYFNRLFAALKENGLLLEFETDDLL